MTTTSATDSLNVGAARRRRRVVTLLVFLGLGVAALLTGWYVLWSMATPEPPVIDLGADPDPEVAKVVEENLDQVRRAPRSASAWGQLGMVLVANGFSEQSEKCFAQAERFDPEEPRWPYLRAMQVLLRDRTGGLEPLRRAVELCDQKDPNNYSPRLLLVTIYAEANDWDQVESQCRHVLDRDPENAWAHLHLGQAALARDDLNASVEHLVKASTSEQTRQRARTQLAAIYRRLGNDRALEENRRELQRLPPDRRWPDPYDEECRHFVAGREYRFFVAERLEVEGRKDEAIRSLKSLAAERPDQRALLALGSAQAKAGDYPAAIENLNAALRLVPDSSPAYFALSLALYGQGERLRERNDAGAEEKYRAAAEAASQAIRLKPDHSMAHYRLGLALKRLGRRSDALTSLRAATLCAPENAEFHIALGETLAEDGKKAEALAELQYAHDLAPHDPHVQEAIDRIHKEMSKP
jgi:tetratricopeptide (TPR) repeat protein